MEVHGGLIILFFPMPFDLTDFLRILNIYICQTNPAAVKLQALDNHLGHPPCESLMIFSADLNCMLAGNSIHVIFACLRTG